MSNFFYKQHKEVTYGYIDKFLNTLRNYIDQYVQKNQNLENEKKDLQNKLKDLENQLSISKEENISLKIEKDGVKRKIEMMRNNTASINKIEEYENILNEKNKQLDEKNKQLKDNIKNIIKTNGDIYSCCQNILGKSIYRYPDTDTITLHRNDPKIEIYDFLGATPFDADTPEIEFTVIEKGWRDDDKSWIEAKISPLK